MSLMISERDFGRRKALRTQPVESKRGKGLEGVRVLVVEDEAMVAMLIEDFLLELGCEVVGPAAMLSKAITMIDREAFDVALLDVNLGGVKVFPVADRLADLGIPFAFSTGYGLAGIEARHTGRPVLQKPYDRPMLEAALHAALAAG